MSSTKSYNYIYIGKKGLENKVILKSEQGQKATIYFYKKTNYISFTTNIANTEFELKINAL
jgi:vacuolar-type H+-ATPase catalytic subunit A/Vma1